MPKIAVISILCALSIFSFGCAGGFRQARIEAVQRVDDTGTVYAFELRHGRAIREGAVVRDEPDEFVTVIVCNDRTPDVCVRIVPRAISTPEERRAFFQQLEEVGTAPPAQ